MNRRIFPLFVFLLMPLAAQDKGARDTRPFVRVTGEASVSAKPDQAEINIGVVTQAPTADDAATQNAKQSTAVIGSLRDILGQAADIKTVNYSLTPIQRYPNNGGSPTITGYSATNTVHVITQSLSVVGKIIDTVTKSGANQIQGILFTLHDDRPVRAQAMRDAAQQARASGDALAAALGLHVVRVVSAETSQPVTVRPYEMAAMARVAAAPTPVEPGSVDVRATVVLTLEVAP
jgi:uncharacterized protein YggE